jgi:hypothetical protein
MMHGAAPQVSLGACRTRTHAVAHSARAVEDVAARLLLSS